MDLSWLNLLVASTARRFRLGVGGNARYALFGYVHPIPFLSSQIVYISTASIAYPHHRGAVRAEVAGRLDPSNLPAGTFVLSTCLRMEITVAGDEPDLERSLSVMLGELRESARPDVRVGESAVTHLFRVAAGLESPILGEQEILTQFRQALIRAEQEGRVGGLFAGLLETAVAAGRRARELLPDSPHDSLAAVAAQVVGSADRVAVLGSGLMATAAVHGLLGLPSPPSVTVVARNPDKVAIEGVEVWPFDRAAEALSAFPAVVSATSAKRLLVDDDAMAAAVLRRTLPLTLVDMAMPPDFEPPDGAAVDYLGIDDLARMADRRPRREDADAFVQAAAADAYRQFVNHHRVGPVIGELMRTADAVVDRTVDRFAGRLGRGDDRAVLQQAAHTVARTLLAGPVAYLKQADRAPEVVDAIADAFGLDDD